MSIALGFGERAVYIENQCFVWFHGVKDSTGWCFSLFRLAYGWVNRFDIKQSIIDGLKITDYHLI